jgi:hypothetical protein
MSVNHGLEAVDLMIGAARWTIAGPDQAQDAKSGIDRPPAIDNATEK